MTELTMAVGGTTAYEYGYAFDGGRRWKKDLAANVWTWFPCGVACSAGDLVEQTSDLTGQSWSTSALYLRGIGCGSSIHRRNSEWHLFDINGVAGVITGGSANILSNNLYDTFGVEMYASGSAATQWRFVGRFVAEEGLVAGAGGGVDVLVGRDLALAAAVGKRKPILACLQKPTLADCLDCCWQPRNECWYLSEQCMDDKPAPRCKAQFDRCMKNANHWVELCIQGCLALHPLATMPGTEVDD